MNTQPVYDESNIFAKILRGELPSHKVYEDNDCIAIMDIMPRSPGHTLVIPKVASRNILDIKQGDLSAIILVAQKIAKAQVKALGADGVTVQLFNEAAGGQMVFHTHFHLIPRKTDVPLKPHMGQVEENDVLARHAESIRNAINK